ncbi:MAG TPA: hypothetical protein VG797_02780 [Phycisphaerales bacterium]|nr:hypothetical protein [Phycisphaerales bacterium]
MNAAGTAMRMGTNVGLSTLRWIARVGSVISVGLLGGFVLTELGNPTPREWVGLALFPFGVMLGMLLGWWRELLGGVVTVGSLALFYAWMIVGDGRVPPGPWFLVFAAPGVLFLVSGMVRRGHERRVMRS